MLTGSGKEKANGEICDKGSEVATLLILKCEIYK